MTMSDEEREAVVTSVKIPRGQLLGIPRSSAQLLIAVVFLQAIGLGAVLFDTRTQSQRNGALVEQGVDCMIALQGEAVRNAENANQAAADHHGYVVPPLPDRVSIPTDVQRRFIEEACTRFFQFQENPGAAPPPAEP